MSETLNVFDPLGSPAFDDEHGPFFVTVRLVNAALAVSGIKRKIALTSSDNRRMHSLYRSKRGILVTRVEKNIFDLEEHHRALARALKHTAFDLE